MLDNEMILRKLCSRIDADFYILKELFDDHPTIRNACFSGRDLIKVMRGELDATYEEKTK